MSQTVITISPEKRATLKRTLSVIFVPNKSPYVAFAAKKQRHDYRLHFRQSDVSRQSS